MTGLNAKTLLSALLGAERNKARYVGLRSGHWADWGIGCDKDEYAVRWQRYDRLAEKTRRALTAKLDEQQAREDALRAALVRAKDALLANWHIADMDEWKNRERLLSDIDAALDGSHE